MVKNISIIHFYCQTLLKIKLVKRVKLYNITIANSFKFLFAENKIKLKKIVLLSLSPTLPAFTCSKYWLFKLVEVDLLFLGLYKVYTLLQCSHATYSSQVICSAYYKSSNFRNARSPLKFEVQVKKTTQTRIGDINFQFIYFSPQTSQNKAVNIMIKITSMEKKSIQI
jgi:hypothetical protein